MKALIFGARAAPYSLTDKRTGELKSGISCPIQYVRCKPDNRQDSLGFTVDVSNCEDPAIAKQLMEWMLREKGPILCALDVDVKGSGEYTSVIITAADFIAPISQIGISLQAGITKREAKQPVSATA